PLPMRKVASFWIVIVTRGSTTHVVQSADDAWIVTDDDTVVSRLNNLSVAFGSIVMIPPSELDPLSENPFKNAFSLLVKRGWRGTSAISGMTTQSFASG